MEAGDIPANGKEFSIEVTLPGAFDNRYQTGKITVTKKEKNNGKNSTP